MITNETIMIRDTDKIELRYNRLINISYSFLNENTLLAGFEIADLTACLMMIYKEVRELIHGEILFEGDISVINYTIKETAEYLFDTANNISEEYMDPDFNLAYDILLEILGTIELVIQYANEEEEYEVSANLSKFRKEFITKYHKKCTDINE